MSRWIEVDETTKTVKETIADMDQCLHMVNEVCTNDRSDIFCDFVDEEYCKTKCPHFTKEDGIITD